MGSTARTCEQVEGWEVYEDGEQRLRLSRTYRAKNFVKVRALQPLSTKVCLE